MNSRAIRSTMSRITSVVSILICMWAIDLSWSYQDDCPAGDGVIPSGVMNAGLAGIYLLLPTSIFRLKVQLSLGLLQAATLLQGVINTGSTSPDYRQSASKQYCPWELHQGALLFQMIVMAFWLQRLIQLWLAIAPKRQAQQAAQSRMS